MYDTFDSMPVNSPENPIKIDKDQSMHKFGEATRLTKIGKGRMDLIPPTVVRSVLNKAYDMFCEEGLVLTSKYDILSNAYVEDPIERAYNVIINLVNYIWADSNESGGGADSAGEQYVETHFSSFVIGFHKMLLDLSKHYENGAKHYGIDNWKKGIPISGGTDGGSFLDSMLRHLSQYGSALEGEMINDSFIFDESGIHIENHDIVFDVYNRKFYRWDEGEQIYVDEEPHHLATIWNAFGIIWTALEQHNTENK